MRLLIVATLSSLMRKRALGFMGKWARPFSLRLLQRQANFGQRPFTQPPFASVAPFRRHCCSRAITFNAINENAIICSVEKSFHDTLAKEILPRISSSLLSGKQQHCIFLLGVSGGCDSVALFHLMRRLLNCDKTNETNTQNMHLHVVHFDHQQRGASSDQDRELVQSLCAAYSVPLTCYYWNDDMQRRDATFTQATARSWRQCTMRELLRRLLQQERDQRNDAVNGMVLTAHHQNDSNETLLLKFLRGTHLTNLQGMPVISQLPGDYDGDDIVYTGRPLLHVTKAQLVAYLRANHFHWRDDDSNESPKYLRNRVRHELVPLLEDLVGGASVLQQKLDNLSQQSDEVNEYLMMRAHEYLKQCGDVKTKYFVLPPQGQLDIVHKHALFLWVRKQSKGQCSLDSASMERLCAQLLAYPDNTQWTINIGGGWDFVRLGNVMELKNNVETADLMEPSTFTNDTILTWRRQLDDHSPNDTSTCLRIKVPSTLLSLQPLITLSSVKTYPKLTVTPTWRPSPIRLAAFLRGQGVPLHEQSNAPIIVLSTANESVLVAVLSKNEWVIDASFIPAANNRDETIEIKLK